MKERVSKLAYPTMIENAAHNECQWHTLVIDNRTEIHNRILVIIGYTIVTFMEYLDTYCQKHIQKASMSLIFVYTC